jgi:uncharacterized SAM-binding protein YcdF (DUF218 family)
VIFCSNDLRVADYASELFNAGIAPKILCSGGVAHQDDLLATGWNEPEAVVFKNRLVELGVPEDSVLVEDKASNTGENVRFSKVFIENNIADCRSITLVQKPFMERRSYATLMKEWPEIQCTVTSPKLSFDEWCRGTEEKERIINILVGDTERIWIYAEKGFMVEQDVPDQVIEAYESLKKEGFDKHAVTL